MKTFRLNITNEIRNWSNALDAKSVLCSRSWIVFNDEGVKEVYIFQKNGCMIASNNGRVIKTRWEYIAQNTSLIIEDIGSDTYMMKPTYYDKKVLALQVDGTRDYVVMINESCAEELMLDSIAKIRLYIEDHQQFVCQKEVETRKEQQEIANQRKEASMALWREKKEWENFISIKAKDYLKSPKTREKIRRQKKNKKYISSCICLSTVAFLLFSVLNNERLSIYAFGIFSFIIIISLIILILVESNSNDEYNAIVKMEKKYPFETFCNK